MPEKKTIERARRAKRQGKAPTTQAGEFVREEFEHIREGKHGARNPKQAIAIGLSKARRASVNVPAPKETTTGRKVPAPKKATKKRKAQESRPNPKRARAASRTLKREGRAAASPRALSRQGRAAAKRRKRRGASTPRRKQKEA
jgi:hypothetical protein